MIENIAIVIENVERTSSGERRREPVGGTPLRGPRRGRRRERRQGRRRERRRENLVGNISIYEMMVCGAIVICCMAVVYALRVVLK
jgi:hypothetical protein